MSDAKIRVTQLAEHKMSLVVAGGGVEIVLVKKGNSAEIVAALDRLIETLKQVRSDLA